MKWYYFTKLHPFKYADAVVQLAFKMNKNLSFFALLLAFSCAFIVTSCDNDDDEPDVQDNVLVVDGTTYQLDNGFFENLSDSPFSSGNGGFDFDVSLLSSSIQLDADNFYTGTGSGINFYFFSASEDQLEAGTYIYTDSGEALTLDDAVYYEEFDFASASAGNVGESVSGIVTVEIIGSETRFEWDLTSADNKSITGSFQGVLQEL